MITYDSRAYEKYTSEADTRTPGLPLLKGSKRYVRATKGGPIKGKHMT
jgi:hypothetical protein